MNARTLLRALAYAAFLCVSASAVAGDDAGSGAPLKIGIIGTGNIGSALATHWAKAGHELVISSRHPEELQDLAKSLGPKVRVGTPREAAQFGAVILLSVPYKATPDIGRDLASEIKGKVLLDTGNPYPMRDGAMAVDARKRGTGVTSKEFLPGVRLVRAFNAINAGNLARDGNHKPERYAIPLASDDAEALRVAERLVRDAGFDPVVVGGLARAREFDWGTKVYTEMLTAKQLRAALGLKEQ
ncbi:MAG TPA: NADPH-dependent F420 reductase [Steroidobacteraceae bacterium]|nr:NADPH-dependent F420 reductase [Steroidobacteraceae bacterium]